MESHYWCSLCWLMRVFPGCVGWEERHGAASSTRVPTCLFFLLLLLFLPPTAAVIIFSLEERLLPTCLPSLSASSSSFFLLLFLDVCFPIKTIKTNRLTRSNCFFVTHYTSGRFYTSRSWFLARFFFSLRANRKALRTSFLLPMRWRAPRTSTFPFNMKKRWWR